MRYDENLDIDKEYEILQSEAVNITALADIEKGIDYRGCNRTTFLILTKTKILSGASLEALALESIKTEEDEEQLRKIALEDLSTSIGEKIQKWTNRILVFVKDMAEKIKRLLEPVWNKIENIFSDLKKFSSDKYEKSKESFKSIDMKTVVSIVGSVAAVAGVVALVLAFTPGDFSNESKLKSITYRFIDAIKKIRFPFAKSIKVVGGTDGNPISCIIENIPNESAFVEGTLKQKGFILNNLNILYNTLKSSFLGIGKFVIGLPDKILILVGSHINIIESIKEERIKRAANVDLGKGRAWLAGKVYWIVVIGFYKTLWDLISKIALKGYRLIRDTLEQVSNTVSKESKATS